MTSERRDRVAGMTIDSSYELCRQINRAHGRTYYLATRLLPRWKRRHVHALYGFTRYTDDIVDQPDGAGTASRAARLRSWTAEFALAAAGGPVTNPVLPAVLDTIDRFDLAPDDFATFLRSMEMDLTVSRYDNYGDLLEYMEGSAAAIGTMMLPLLGARDLPGAREPARQLGFAFQLTNFIRDVAEDLDRGRIYLPLKDLADFGLTEADLYNRTPTRAVRALIAFEVGRARGHYLRAAPGIDLLDSTSRRCIRTAYTLYGGILDEIVRADHDVFSHRATVSDRHKLAVVAANLLTPASVRARIPGT